MDKYGGVCKCCGESNVVFLSIDHINGDGAKERNETQMVSGRLYKFLNKNPVDKKYQVLCYNCNLAKGDRKECPHKYMDKVNEALNWEKPIPQRDRRYISEGNI